MTSEYENEWWFISVKVLFLPAIRRWYEYFKTKKPFLITSEAIANNSSRCIQNLLIYSLVVTRFTTGLSFYKRSRRIMLRDTLNWPLGTVFKCEVAPVQVRFSSYEGIRFMFQIYNFRFQMNVGSSGATDVTKYLKLSKITNFLRQGSDTVQKIVVFHNFR